MYVSNPLSDRERVHVMRLYDHDTVSLLHSVRDVLELADMLVEDGKWEELAAKRVRLTHAQEWVGHVHYMSRAMAKLAEDTVHLTNWNEPPNYTSVIRVLEQAVVLSRGNVEAAGEMPIDFRTNASVLYCMLFNLVKNGVAAQRKLSKDLEKEPVRLRAEMYVGVPPACFVPSGCEGYEKFVRFSVQDCGKGFGSDVALEELFYREAPAKWEHGFGLYFVGLAARVLRAPIGIESVAGDTKVSLYHPVFREE